MTIDLTGQVAIVTGAAGGLGKAYAKALSQRGAAIVCNDLGGDTRGENGSPLLAQLIANEICAAGGKAVANADTVATAAGGRSITQTALDAFGRIDIVVNNAGNQRNALFEDMSEEDIESVLAVHLKGAFYVTQPAYRQMKEQGYGRIIFTSSQSGVFGNPYRTNYGAAKSGTIGLMRALVQEAPDGIRINCVLPNSRDSRMGTPEEKRVDADFIAKILSRGHQFSDNTSSEFVASLVTYLASDACKYTGEAFSVLRGHYGRVFSGLVRGWVAEEGKAPSPELIDEQMESIRNPVEWMEPDNGIDEGDRVTAYLERVYAEREDNN